MMKDDKLRISIYTNQNKELIDIFKNKRKNLNLTIRDLAKELNISHSIVGKIETGDRKLSVLEFINYCKVLKLNPCEVIQQIS